VNLVGLLPPRTLDLDQQATRAYAQYHAQPSDLPKNVSVSALHDRNDVLFQLDARHSSVPNLKEFR
jgi:malate dehydrogenase (oxaloacetate-decarboxylating)